MSWTATSYARNLHLDPAGRKLPFSEKALLLYLADSYNDELGCAWPSVKTLSADSHLGERQIRTLLGSLAERGVIRIEERSRPDGSRTSNYYYFPALPPTARTPAIPAKKPVNPAGGHEDIAGVGARIAGQDPVSDPISDPVKDPTGGALSSPAPKRPLTEEYVQTLVAEFAPEFGGGAQGIAAVLESIHLCRSHKVFKGYTDQCAGVRNWVKGDRDKYQRAHPPARGGTSRGYQPPQSFAPKPPSAGDPRRSFRAPDGWQPPATSDSGGATV